MKVLKTSFFFILATFIFGFAFACKKADPAKSIAKVELQFAQSETKDTVKSDFKVPTKIDNFKIEWQSSNEKVVQISNGTAVVAQQDADVDVKITAKIGDLTKTFNIKVLGKGAQPQPGPTPDGNKVDKAEFDKVIADAEKLAELDFTDKEPEMVEKDKKYIKTRTKKDNFVARLNALKEADSQNLSKKELGEYKILKGQVERLSQNIKTGMKAEGYISESEAQKLLTGVKHLLATPIWSEKEPSEFDLGTKYVNASEAKKTQLDTLAKTVAKYQFNKVLEGDENTKFEELKQLYTELFALVKEGTKPLQDGKNISQEVEATLQKAGEIKNLRWDSRKPEQVKKDTKYVQESSKKKGDFENQIEAITEKFLAKEFDMAPAALQEEFNKFKNLVEKYEKLIKTGEQISLKDNAAQVIANAEKLKNLPFENKEPDQVSGKYVKADSEKREQFNTNYNAVKKVKTEKWDEGYTKAESDQLDELQRLVAELLPLITEGTKVEEPGSIKLVKDYDFASMKNAKGGYKGKKQQIKNLVNGSDDTLDVSGLNKNGNKTGFTVAKENTEGFIEIGLGKTVSKVKVEFLMEKWFKQNKFEKLEVQYKVNGEWKTAREFTSVDDIHAKLLAVEINEATDTIRLRLSKTSKALDNSHSRFDIKTLKVYH